VREARCVNIFSAGALPTHTTGEQCFKQTSFSFIYTIIWLLFNDFVKVSVLLRPTIPTKCGEQPASDCSYLWSFCLGLWQFACFSLRGVAKWVAVGGPRMQMQRVTVKGLAWVKGAGCSAQLPLQLIENTKFPLSRRQII